MEITFLIYDPYKSASEIKAAGCEPVADLDAALPRADFVSIHCPKTSETDGKVNAGACEAHDAARLSDQPRARRDHRRAGAARCAGVGQARRRGSRRLRAVAAAGRSFAVRASPCH